MFVIDLEESLGEGDTFVVGVIPLKRGNAFETEKGIRLFPVPRSVPFSRVCYGTICKS